MPHKLLLGFKQNPSGSDDYIDLGGGLNSGNVGYHLYSYQEGPDRLDDFGNRVRDLTIVVGIDDATVSGALRKYREIKRYPQQSRIYLEQFQGNYSGTTDGTWYSGFCATLTFQPVGATQPIYWDVLDGDAVLTEAFLGPDIVGKKLENVTVTLTVRYSARGDLVRLNNLVAMGSFEPPFDPKDSYFDADWTFANTAVWSVDRAAGKFGLNALKWVGVASTTASTNENFDLWDLSRDVSNNQVETIIPAISASISIKTSGVTGSTLVELQGYSGSVWNTIGTLANVAGNLADWTYYKIENVSIISGVQTVRLKITTPTAGTVYFDGAAIWRAATVPVNGEYFTSGLKVAFPSTYLYNAAGDLEAPCLLHVGVSTNRTAGPSVGFVSVTAGARKYKWQSAGRDSIASLAGRFATGSANTALFWGQNGQGAAGTGTSALFYGNPGTNLSNPIFKVPRKYRVFLAYTSNVTAVGVNLYLNGSISHGAYKKITVTKSIPPTTGNPLFELGDLVFPPPGNAAQNQIYTDISDPSTLATGIATQFLFASSISYSITFGGLVLIPYEMFATLSGVYSSGAIFSSMADPENGSVYSLQGDVATYDPAKASELGTDQIDNSANLRVIPGAMQFEILALASRSITYPDLYTYNGGDPISPTLVYQPRYLGGGL